MLQNVGKAQLNQYMVGVSLPGPWSRTENIQRSQSSMIMFAIQENDFCSQEAT